MTNKLLNVKDQRINKCNLSSFTQKVISFMNINLEAIRISNFDIIKRFRM